LWTNGKTIPPISKPPEYIETLGLLNQDPQSLESLQIFQQQRQQRGMGLSNDALSKLILAPKKSILVQPDVQVYPQFDSGLVFLCYRGYNHCQGKISSKALKWISPPPKCIYWWWWCCLFFWTVATQWAKEISWSQDLYTGLHIC